MEASAEIAIATELARRTIDDWRQKLERDLNS